MRSRCRAAPFAIGWALAVGTLPLRGQESPSPLPASAPPDATAPPQESERPAVVVTASPLHPAEVFDTPYSAEVLDGHTMIRDRLARTLPDALKEAAGISVQKTSHGHGSPFIRGFTGFRNVMLVDGIRLNNSVFREGPNQYWNTVDEFLVDRIEVVRGPSSVLYGSDSIGGTVVAYTREPDREADAFRSRSFYRFAGAEDSHTARQEASGNAGNLGYLVGVTYRDFGDLDGGRHLGPMPGTGYGEYDGDFKFVHRLSGRSRLVMAFQHTRQNEVPRTHRTTASRSWNGTIVGTDARADFDQARDLIYVQYHATYENAAVDALKASLSWHEVGERFLRVTPSTGATSSRQEVRALAVRTPGAWAQAGKDTAWGFFTGGAEWYRDRVASSGHDWLVNGTLRSFARGEVADDATYDLFGIYLQDEFSLGGLDVTPGIRFTRAAVDADEVDPIPGDAVVFDDVDDDYRAVTGSLRLLYHVNESWNVIGGWGMGFRTPSLDDTTAIKLVMSGALDLPAEGLDPEESDTFDLGVRTRGDGYEAGAFGFVTLLDDFIRRVPAGDFNGDGTADNTKDNFSEGRLYGFELGGSCRLTDEALIRADYGVVHGEADALVGGIRDKQPLDKMNPPIAHVGLRYEPRGARAWIEGFVTAARKPAHLSPSDEADLQRIPPGGPPGYVVYGLRGGYRATDRVNVSLAIENLTNKDYRVFGSGQNEPGTNVILGVEATF